MRVFLIGFMCSGKSSVGELLAKKLNFRFIDLDKVIVDRFGKSIKDIFAEMGEGFFRKIEHEVLRETIYFDDIVVATGGGTVTKYSSFTLLKRYGMVIWLHPPFDVLIDRIRVASKEDRPLAKDYNSLKFLYETRSSYYERVADLVIDIKGYESIEEVAERIFLILKSIV